MSIRGPGPFNQLYRVEALEGDSKDNQSDEKKKRKVLYQGREWSDHEEELPLQPVAPSGKTSGLKQGYADPILLQKAEQFYKSLLTVEDKLAQLFFLPTCAIYDQDEQKRLEEMICRYNPGGILFSKGDYHREGYLIEHYHSLAKTPLLFGNDFFLGLSFYFQGKIPLEALLQEEDEKHFYELGRAVMSLNRKLGIHIQFERERLGVEEPLHLILQEKQYRAFCKGIKDAKGIVAREKPFKKKERYYKQNALLSAGSLQAPLYRIEEAAETIGIRTLYVIEFSQKVISNEKMLLAELKKPIDAFIVKEGFDEAIEKMHHLYKSGLLTDEDIERRVMRVLLMKSLFYDPISIFL